MGSMGGRRTTALLVEADVDERERLGLALERAGFDVVSCSGPTGPDYVCVGGREGRCVLLDAADVVILDLWLESDTVMMGTPSQELLRLYVGQGRPVVALGSHDRLNHTFADDPVTRIERMPTADALVEAVRSALRSGSE